MKKGLGRGLNTLIGFGDDLNQTVSGEGVGEATEINIMKIKPNPDQPRKVFSDEELEELSESIKEFGVVQPLIVTPRGEGGGYMIVAGERRWRASQLAGLSTIPAIIRNYTDFEILGIALIENVQRQNLNPIEEANCYKRLTEEFDMTQEDLAKRVGKSRSHISNSMRVLRLDPRVLDMISEEKLTMGHAKPILSIEAGDAQFDAASKMVEQGMNVRQAEDFVRRYTAQLEAGENPEDMAPPEENPAVAEIRNKYKADLRDALGTRVNIKESKTSGGGGKIEINYFSGEDLDRIVDLIKSHG